MTMNKRDIDTWCWTCDGIGKVFVPKSRDGKIVYVTEVCGSCNGTGRRAKRSVPNAGGLAISRDVQATLDLDDDDLSF